MSQPAETRLTKARQSVSLVGAMSVFCSFFLASAVMDPWGDIPPPPDPGLARGIWVYVVLGLGHLLVASQLGRRRWRTVGLGFAAVSWIPFGTVPPCLWPFSLVAGIELWRALHDEGVTRLFEEPARQSYTGLGIWSAVLAGSVYVGASMTTPGHRGSGGVISALRTLMGAQYQFRDGDKEGDQNLDYGTLAELSEAGLIDGVLGSGTRHGFVYEVHVDPEQPTDHWWAHVSPTDAGSGASYYAVTQDGEIKTSPEALQLGPDWTIQGGTPYR